VGLFKIFLVVVTDEFPLSGWLLMFMVDVLELGSDSCEIVLLVGAGGKVAAPNMADSFCMVSLRGLRFSR